MTKIDGGIFSGMFSPHDQRAVMSGFGDKFLTDLAWSVRGAREDLAELREWRPAWFPPMSRRCLANLIHDRIWARLVAAVDGTPGIETIDREPVREFTRPDLPTVDLFDATRIDERDEGGSAS
jgi:hypothetical protein